MFVDFDDCFRISSAVRRNGFSMMFSRPISRFGSHDQNETLFAMYLKPSILIIFLLAAITPQACAQGQTTANTLQASSVAPQKYSQEGISLEFKMTPLAGDATNELLEGIEATVHFKIVDANTGKTLSNLRPTAWIDR